MQYAEPIERLIRALTRLPGIGEKTASRLALYMLNAHGVAEELAGSIGTLKQSVKLCSECMGFSEKDPCPVCSDASRDASLVCVVSDFKDMAAIESSGTFRGAYHILHGNLAPLKGVGPDEIRLKELIDRLGKGSVKELIIATGFDPEGEATAVYIAKLARPYGVTVSRIASGVPVGAYVEFMDPATLARALNNRTGAF